MAQARQILTRISSVKNTQKITRAMKMVAAAKLNRAQSRMEGMRPYAAGIAGIFNEIAPVLVGDEHPLLKPRPVKKVLSIVVAGDRGLCGGFNNGVLRAAQRHLLEMPGVAHVLYAVGKRSISGLRKFKFPLLKSWYDVFDKLSFILSGDIAKELIDLYQVKGPDRVDEVYLVYNKFVSRMAQEPVAQRILPLDLTAIKAEAAKVERPEGYVRPVYQIEPSAERAVQELVRHYLSCQIYHGIIESYAAELAARMAAMDNASSSAEEMIQTLTLDFNRARQAGITSELLDIIGGANALG